MEAYHWSARATPRGAIVDAAARRGLVVQRPLHGRWAAQGGGVPIRSPEGRSNWSGAQRVRTNAQGAPIERLSGPRRYHSVGAANRHHRQEPGTLDSQGQSPLVLGAHARLASRLHLELVGDVPLEYRDVLVVYVLDVIHTEGADLSTSVVTRPASSHSGSRRRRRR